MPNHARRHRCTARRRSPLCDANWCMVVARAQGPRTARPAPTCGNLEPSVRRGAQKGQLRRGSGGAAPNSTGVGVASRRGMRGPRRPAPPAPHASAPARTPRPLAPSQALASAGRRAPAPARACCFFAPPTCDHSDKDRPGRTPRHVRHCATKAVGELWPQSPPAEGKRKAPARIRQGATTLGRPRYKHEHRFETTTHDPAARRDGRRQLRHTATAQPREQERHHPTMLLRKLNDPRGARLEPSARASNECENRWKARTSA